MKKQHVLLLVLLMTSLWSMAQCNLTIRGKVIDEHDQEELSAASIEIIELNRAVISDDQGSFLIDNLCAGTYTLVCKHVGCTPIKETVTLKEDMELNFYPEHHVQMLQEIDLLYSDGLTKIKTEEKVDPIPQTSSVSELLEALPNVKRIKTGVGLDIPMLQGLHTNRLALVDDLTQLASQQWGLEHAPELEVNGVQSTELVNGSDRLFYDASAAAGVLRLKSKPMVYNADASSSAGISYNSNGRGFSSSFQHQQSLMGGWHPILALDLNLSKNGNLHAPDYYLANTAAQKASGKVKLQLQAGSWLHQIKLATFAQQQGIFAGAHIGNLTDLALAIESEKPLVKDEFSYTIAPPKQEVQHYTASIKSSRYLAKHKKLSAQYSYQRNSRAEFDEEEQPFMDLSLQTHQFNLRLDEQRSKADYAYALLSSLQQNSYLGSFFIPNFQKVNLAWFTSRKQSIENGSLDLAVRLDYKHQQSYFYRNNELQDPEQHAFGPAVNLSYIKQFEHRAWALHASTTWRQPEVNELYANGLHHGAASLERGNENLKNERSYQIEANFKQQLSPSFSLSANPFVRYIPNYIYLQLTPEPVLTIRGAFPAYDFKQAEAFFTGIDWELSKDFGLVNLSLGHSSIYARNLDEEAYFPLLPADQLFVSLETVNIRVNHVETKVLLKASQVFKQKRYPAEQDYQESPDAYQLVDLKLNSSYKQFDFGFAVDNLFNQSYRNFLNRFRYFADEPGRNFNFYFKINLQ